MDKTCFNCILLKSPPSPLPQFPPPIPPLPQVTHCHLGDVKVLGGGDGATMMGQRWAVQCTGNGKIRGVRKGVKKKIILNTRVDIQVKGKIILNTRVDIQVKGKIIQHLLNSLYMMAAFFMCGNDHLILLFHIWCLRFSFLKF